MTNQMGNNQIKKRAAESHNKKRYEQLTLEKDKLENPEKYRRKRRVRSGSSMMPFITTAMAISPNWLDLNIKKPLDCGFLGETIS